MKNHYTVEDLKNIPHKCDSLIGIDSDGCVFDSMTVKQKEHFHPLIIRFWNLEQCEKELRACAEFVNLYSKNRGINRFPALLYTFELFAEYPGMRAAGIELPRTEALRAYIESGLPLGNPTLTQEAERTGDPELKRLLEWSLAINEDIDRNMREIPPFKWALKALQMIDGRSDVFVVSQTPEEALVKEWNLHDIHRYVYLIAGQELGTKKEHLALAADGKYTPKRILMIGDAPGDFKAAVGNSALFYPITPGREESSWERFCTEAFEKFLGGTFEGVYQQALLDEFDASLPEHPPWA
jgi:phosphoglycolate phosphatase-like HAD superfamily hydrolase